MIRQKFEELYARAAHRVQTALAFMPNAGVMEPKHMRVGIDMSKADIGAIVALLLEKKIFTEEELYDKLIEYANLEADSYENELSSQLNNANIKTF